jgi:tetratricopeptide (TPR) repeat protein
MSNVKNTAIVILVLVSFLFSCSQRSQKQVKELGEIDFKVTGAALAQADFKTGLLLLHSFEFDDAADAFRKAITADKDFVMAYWGEAMTHNHPLWRYQAYDKAIAVLNKLAPTPQARIEKAKTAIEKDFISSLDILYGKGSKTERDSAYAVFMGKLHEKYPGNSEVTAFYSLALLGSVPVGRDEKIYARAADMAEEVIKANPKHPGALHYLIHAYDDPGHAALAVNTADAYSLTAPSAGHALHMPTHIYLALGMWDKVISSNVAAWQAGMERKERKKLTNDALNYHAFHWLMYGYLQSGETEKAKRVLDSMTVYCKTLSSGKAREHLIYQKTTYLAETNDYKNKISNVDVKQEDLNIVTRAMNYYADGIRCYSDKDEIGLGDIINKLTGAILIDEERISNDGAGVCGTVNSPLPNSLDIQQSQVMLLELKGKMAWLKKDEVLTNKLFKQAADLENGISYAYGPPTVVKPSAEIYAEWLLEVNKPAEALEQFNNSLKTTPGRLLSLKGKEKATAMLGVEK